MCLTGNETGEVFEWDDNARLVRAHRGHNAAVQQLVAAEGSTIISGGVDGKIIIWGRELQRHREIDVASMTAARPGITALDFKEDTKGYLVGTLGAEVFEVNAQGTREADLVTGHFCLSDEYGAGKVRALACHPTEQLFVTAAADRCLRFWAGTKQEAVASDFADEIVAIDWSSCGRFLLVGDTRGQVYSVDASTRRLVHKCQHKQKAARKDTAVAAVKISANNVQAAFSVAAGSGFDLVNIDSTSFQLRHERAVDVKQSIVNLDWSTDSEYLALCSKTTLVFYETRSGKEVTHKQVSQVAWKSWTSKLGFSVQGIWSDHRYSSVNAVATSHSKMFLATAEESGSLKLFKNPCTVHKAHHHDHQGHGSSVSALAFSAADKFLVSTGSRDQGVLVWETDFGGEKGPLLDDDDEAAPEQDPGDLEYFAFEVDLVDKSKEIK